MMRPSMLCALAILGFAGATAGCDQRSVSRSATVRPPQAWPVSAPERPGASAPPVPPIPDPPPELAAPSAGETAAAASASQPALTQAPAASAPAAAPTQVPADPAAAAINQAAWSSAPAGAASGQAPDPLLLRAQVLLARAHFSPGVIDGRQGGNFRQALAGFETAHGLPVDARLTRPVFDALVAQDAAPVVADYVITAQDLKGPFTPPVRPNDFAAMAKLPRLDYSSPLEELAERFHMDEALLKRLNPQARFDTAGVHILVASVQTGDLTPVKTVEVDKERRQVRALDAGGRLVAAYPATVGSAERPAPSGTFTIKGVAWNPTYTYDPRRLTFGDPAIGKVTVKPGPNNPVGAVWIDLSIPTYGIHGAPDPRLVGKAASHGCVRLTNWDVRELARAVKPGVRVVFLGRDPGGTPPAVGASIRPQARHGVRRPG